MKKFPTSVMMISRSSNNEIVRVEGLLIASMIDFPSSVGEVVGKESTL
jgi:hypothetical protein